MMTPPLSRAQVRRNRWSRRWSRVKSLRYWATVIGPMYNKRTHQLYVRVHVRRWHPGLWWLVARAVLRSMRAKHQAGA